MIIVEDGTGVSGANSYASVVDLFNYAEQTRKDIGGDAASLLISAKRYIETLNFIGKKTSAANEMQWPRSGALIDGFYVGSTEIPKLLIELQCEVALSVDAGLDPLATQSRAVKREKVGEIDIEYTDGANISDINPAINALMSKLIVGGSSRGVYLSLSRA